MFDMTAVPGLCVLLLSSFHLVKHHDSTDRFHTVHMTACAHNSSPKTANNDCCYHLRQGGYCILLPVCGYVLVQSKETDPGIVSFV